MAKPLSLILASTSPRRIDLLAQAGLRARAQAPGTDEAIRPGETPAAMVRRLAREKASSVARKLAPGSRALVIAADTTVVAPDGRMILGKPDDARDAARMLRLLSGRVHTVLTGYCLFEVGPRPRKPLVRSVRSRVRMRKLSPRDIQAYIRTGEPMDKAGSYAAQGVGMALIESLQGSYSNVVGLPMCQVLLDLEHEFGLGLFRG